MGIVTASLGLAPAPAGAAPGDAAALGLSVELAATVDGVAVLSSSVSAGSATAPPGGGERLASVNASGTGVAGGAATVDVSATSGPTGSSARSTITGLDLDLLGVDALNAELVEATASCPTFGSGDGRTTIAGSGLAVLGQSVSLEAQTQATASAAVDLGVGGLAGATLDAVVRRIEVDEPTAARATAVEVAFTLTVSPLVGPPQSVSVGQVTLAQASCERPTPPPLSLGSLEPSAGPLAGGTTVTITGGGFIPGATTVTFGDLGPLNATVSDDGTALTVVTPSSPRPGPVDVTVATPAEAATLPAAYTYLAAGGAGATGGAATVVTGVEPGGGPTSGGTTVTISGSGLQDATGVTFGGVAATGVTASPDGTRLVATTPARETAGSVPVVLNGPSPAEVGTFTYNAPTITGVAPDRGPLAGGTRVVVTGSGLAGTEAVTFDGREGTDVAPAPDGTSLAVTAPAGRQPGPVALVVRLPGQDATAPGAYTYLDDGTRPAITGLDPDSGPASGGTVVTLTGSGLAGAAGVTFGGIPGSDLRINPEGTRLTVTTPAGPVGEVPVVVSFPASDTEVRAARAFTYQPAAGAASPATSRRGGGSLLAQTGVPLLGVALVATALATAGHLLRRRA